MTTPDTSIASRSLDLFIAEHIMGYRRQGGSERTAWYEPTGRFLGRDSDVPHFSSDRSAAFELASSFNYRSIAEARNANTGGIEHFCLVVIEDAPASGSIADMPLLVCRAALQAKGLSL